MVAHRKHRRHTPRTWLWHVRTLPQHHPQNDKHDNLLDRLHALHNPQEAAEADATKGNPLADLAREYGLSAYRALVEDR